MRSKTGDQLTTAEFDPARLVVHRVLDEHHVAGERQRESLTVEDRAVRRQTDQPIGHGDRVEATGLEVANEHVGRPHAVELFVVERHVAVSRESESLVAPDLSQVQRRRVFLHNATHRPIKAVGYLLHKPGSR